MITRGRRSNTHRLATSGSQNNKQSNSQKSKLSSVTSTTSTTRSTRSPSPARVIRMQEKEELQNLNTRFANFINHTRKLEEENQHLSTIVSSKLNDSYSDMDKLKSMYDSELADVRRLLDVVSNEKAQLQIKLGKITAEAAESKQKVDHLEFSLNDLRESNSTTFSELSKKTIKCDTLKSSLHESSEALKKSAADVASLKKQLATAQNQLEVETLSRIEAENSLQSLKESHNFNLSLGREFSPHSVSLQNGQLFPGLNMQDMYDTVKDQLNDEITEAIKALESTHKTKIDNLNKQLENKDEQINQLNQRADSLDQRVLAANIEINKYADDIAKLNKDLRNKQAELDHANDTYRKEISRKIDYINEIRATLDSTLAEHEDLYDAKLRLDTEIAAYRNLMEMEENRLNLSSQVPVKRRRTDSVSFRSMSYSVGKVQISDADELGSYVCVVNTGDKEADVGGWSLRQTVGSEIVSYVFPEGLKLGALGSCKVWSAGETVGEEEGAVVMDGKGWMSGDLAVVRLFDGDGTEISKREINKMPSLRRSQEDGKCCVM